MSMISCVVSLAPSQSHICGPNYFELEIGLYKSIPIVYVNCYFFHFGCSSGRSVIRKIIMYIVKNNTFELPEINCQHFFDSSKLTYKIIQQTVLRIEITFLEFQLHVVVTIICYVYLFSGGRTVKKVKTKSLIAT